MTENIITVPRVLEDLAALVADYEPNWDNYSKGLLSAALAEGMKDTYGDPELGERNYWHLEQKAFLFFRLEIEARRIAVYEHDAITNQDSIIDPDHWTHVPKSLLPTSLFVDFLAPASAATPLFLRLEKAFVYRRQFETLISTRLISPPDSAWQRNAIKRAVWVRWEGVPPAPSVMSAKERDREIIRWVDENGYRRSKADTFSPATIRRALREMLSELLTNQR
jgi:hypothetical protein